MLPSASPRRQSSPRPSPRRSAPRAYTCWPERRGLSTTTVPGPGMGTSAHHFPPDLSDHPRAPPSQRPLRLWHAGARRAAAKPARAASHLGRLPPHGHGQKCCAGSLRPRWRQSRWALRPHARAQGRSIQGRCQKARGIGHAPARLAANWAASVSLSSTLPPPAAGAHPEVKAGAGLRRRCKGHEGIGKGAREPFQKAKVYRGPV